MVANVSQNSEMRLELSKASRLGTLCYQLPPPSWQCPPLCWGSRWSRSRWSVIRWVLQGGTFLLVAIQVSWWRNQRNRWPIHAGCQVTVQGNRWPCRREKGMRPGALCCRLPELPVHWLAILVGCLVSKFGWLVVWCHYWLHLTVRRLAILSTPLSSATPLPTLWGGSQCNFLKLIWFVLHCFQVLFDQTLKNVKSISCNG